MVVTDTKGVRHEQLYDREDEDLVQSRSWYVNSHGYAVSTAGTGGKAVYLAREILGLVAGDGRIGDHISGDVSDNRRTNLRIVDHQRNIQHQAVVNGRGASRYRGVIWDHGKKRWCARGKIDGQAHHVGYFLTEEDAASALIVWREVNGLPSGY